MQIIGFFFYCLVYLIVYLGMNISERIAFERIQKGLTKKDIAEKLGVTPAYYGRLEKRDKLLSIEQIEQIAKAIDIPPEYILVENLVLTQQLEIRAKVFFEMTILSWIKDSIDEILKAFKSNLSDNLIIQKWQDKSKLCDILVKVGERRINTTNILSELDKLVFDYLEKWDLIVSKTQSNLIVVSLLDTETSQIKQGFVVRKS